MSTNHFVWPNGDIKNGVHYIVSESFADYFISYGYGGMTHELSEKYSATFVDAYYSLCQTIVSFWPTTVTEADDKRWCTIEIPARDFRRHINEATADPARTAPVYSWLALLHQVTKAYAADAVTRAETPNPVNEIDERTRLIRRRGRGNCHEYA